MGSNISGNQTAILLKGKKFYELYNYTYAIFKADNHRPYPYRIFWLIAFTCAVSLALFLIRDVLHKYHRNPVIVSFQPFETQIEKIPFPAVTVCNMNKVLRSKAINFIK